MRAGVYLPRRLLSQTTAALSTMLADCALRRLLLQATPLLAARSLRMQARPGIFLDRASSLAR
jgi:hypothetical protein